MNDYRGRRPYGTGPDLPVINRYTCGAAVSALAIWGAIICSVIALGVVAGIVRW